MGARQSFAGYVDDLWHAKPPAYRPYPVILVHGTISSKSVWQNLVTDLRDDGFVVFAPDYGRHGTGEIRQSAKDVGAYIDQVLSATGAEKVDIVAFQTTLEPAFADYAKRFGKDKIEAIRTYK